EFIKEFQDSFGKKTEIEINAQPTGLDKLFSRVKLPTKEANDASARVKEMLDLRALTRDLINLAAGLSDTAQTTVREVVKLFPRISLPFKTFAEDLEDFLQNTGYAFDGWAARKV